MLFLYYCTLKALKLQQRKFYKVNLAMECEMSKNRHIFETQYYTDEEGTMNR